MPNWNKLACSKLYTLFVKPWFMNMSPATYFQLKITGNNISLILEPAALCMHGFAMFMTFSSLLIDPAGKRYDTQKLEGSIRYTRQLQI